MMSRTERAALQRLTITPAPAFSAEFENARGALANSVPDLLSDLEQLRTAALAVVNGGEPDELRRLVDVMGADVEPVEDYTGPRHRFYLGAHLTWETDNAGKVIGLEIMPYQEDPGFTETYPGADGDEGDADNARNVADYDGWDLPALSCLPDPITWEV